MYSAKSGRDQGTLFQLRNLLNRSSVCSDPEKNMKSCEDFLLVVLHAHVVSAANAILQLRDVNLKMLSKSIVSNYVLLPDFSKQSQEESPDLVNVYAMEVISLGLLWHGYHDAIREGDGDRILRYWKFMLVLFKTSKNYNYAKEAVNLLMSQKYLLSERKSAQLLWSRTVNTSGRAGCNIPMDLHLEHMNRRLKQILSTTSPNVSDKMVLKAGKALRVVHQVCNAFEAETCQATISNRHPYPAFSKDLKKILAVLDEVNVFNTVGDRKHSSFEFKNGWLQHFSQEKIIDMIRKNVEQITMP